jgi:hypothetical protein
MGRSNKRSTTKTDQREKRSCINPHRSTNAVVPRPTMYHAPPITLSKFVLSYDQLYFMNYNIDIYVCLYSRHWILAMICPKISWIFILDPLDIDESRGRCQGGSPRPILGFKLFPIFKKKILFFLI